MISSRPPRGAAAALRGDFFFGQPRPPSFFPQFPRVRLGENVTGATGPGWRGWGGGDGRDGDEKTTRAKKKGGEKKKARTSRVR